MVRYKVSICEAAFSLQIGKVMADSQGVHFSGGGGNDTYVVCTAVNSSVAVKQLNLKLGMHIRQFYNLKIGSLVRANSSKQRRQLMGS